jgi:RNA polymerase sigma-70 factor (ECF subfamily)
MMPRSHSTDEQLALRVQRGELDAVSILYERWKQGLYRFCFRMVLDASAAEDIIHDAFVMLIARREQVQSPAALRSWMYAVVRNGALAWLQRTKRNRPLTDDDDEVMDESSLPMMLETEERSEQITALLDALLPQYKEVLLLREYEGMEYEQIAIVTGSSVSAVKSRLFKARKALMLRMEPLRKGNDL